MCEACTVCVLRSRLQVEIEAGGAHEPIGHPHAVYPRAHVPADTHTHSRAQGDNDEEDEDVDEEEHNEEDSAISASGGRLFKPCKVPPPPAHI
jgi:hypothetical protein